MKLLIAIVLVALPLGCTHATEDAAEKQGEARSPGKPLHPLQVEVTSEDNLQAGVESKAKIAVSSTREIESLEISVEAPAGMTLAEDRFQRYRPDFVHGEVQLPLQFRPATSGAQQVKIHLRATDATGRVMSRTVNVSLGGEGEKRPDKRNRELHAPAEAGDDAGDVVVKGEQEVRRKY